MRNCTLVREVDLDGHVDEKGIRYVGKAYRQSDGTYRCLAEIGGTLSLVQVKLTFVGKATF